MNVGAMYRRDKRWARDISTSRRVHFVVGNRIQLDNALAVVREMKSDRIRFVDLDRGVSTSRAPEFARHNPTNSLRRIVFCRNLDICSGDVVILPQDVGILTRAISRRARNKRAICVLLPDGIAGRGDQHNRAGVRASVKTWINSALKMLGVLDGSPGVMGSTGPHTIFSYGPAWDMGFSAPGKTKFMYSAPPRLSHLVDIAPPPGLGRILIASQPLNKAATWAAQHQNDWYRILSELFERPDLEHIRIRLHPAESDSIHVPIAVRRAYAEKPLAEDLAWADLVVTPMSSIAVEALAAFRPTFSLNFSDEFVRGVAAYPLYADSNTIFLPPTASGVLDAPVKPTGSLALMQAAYCVNPANSAQFVAREVLHLLANGADETGSM